jgi:hypothetical protein
VLAGSGLSGFPADGINLATAVMHVQRVPRRSKGKHQQDYDGKKLFHRTKVACFAATVKRDAAISSTGIPTCKKKGKPVRACLFRHNRFGIFSYLAAVEPAFIIL